MQLLSVLAAALAIAPAAAVPRRQSGPGCTNPEKKIEWRELDPADQKGYIDAVLCLKTKPSRMGLSSPLYDDFPHLHFELSNYIHGGAPFLPWHRYFVHVYLTALRDCGYKGPGTYWDWSKDTAGLRLSPVMSSDHGFGGNGNPNKTETLSNGQTIQCVDSGPFSELRPEYIGLDPKTMASGGHCLWRDLPEVSEPEAYAEMAKMFGPEGVAEVQAIGNWTDYHGSIEGSPHGPIHASLGGEMNPTTSPNEPLFFLHHAQIDHLWWLWQQQNSTRLTEYNGQALLFNQTEYKPATLDDPLLMGGIADDVTIRDVIDTRSERLCYTY